MKTKNFFESFSAKSMIVAAVMLVVAGAGTAIVSAQSAQTTPTSTTGSSFTVNDYTDLSNVADQWGFKVTSTTGDQHTEGSAHYQGRAVDVRTKDKTPEEITAFMKALRKAGIKVLDERIKPKGKTDWTDSHLHLQIGLRDCTDLSGYVETNKFSLNSTDTCQGRAVDVSTNGKTPQEIKKFIADARGWGIKVLDKRKKPKNPNEKWDGPYLLLQVPKTKPIIAPLPPEAPAPQALCFLDSDCHSGEFCDTGLCKVGKAPANRSDLEKNLNAPQQTYLSTVALSMDLAGQVPDEGSTNAHMDVTMTLDQDGNSKGTFSYSCNNPGNRNQDWQKAAVVGISFTSSEKAGEIDKMGDGVNVWFFGPTGRYFPDSSRLGHLCPSVYGPQGMVDDVLDDVFKVVMKGVLSYADVKSIGRPIHSGEVVNLTGNVPPKDGVYDSLNYSGTLTVKY